MESQAGSGLEEVEALLNATTSAPSFGLNSRELILRAAQQACSEQEDELPEAPSNSTYTEAPSATQTAARAEGRQPLSGMLAERLIHDGLTVHERPIVQYVPRSSIPRVARQGVADRLAGQHLANLLEQAGIEVSVEGVRQLEAASARRNAVSAALAQELSIFRSASSKQVYMNKAARTSADHAFLPTEALPQAAREETKAETHVPSDPKNDPESEGAEKSNPEQHPEDCPVKRKSLPASLDADKAKRSKVDGSAIKSPALVLKTADIDWEAASGAESDSHDEREISPISSHKERGEVQVSLGEEELRQATLHFVKAILNPLYHSQVLDKDMYKKVLQKVVDKILRTHSGAADASFLIDEASRIQKLVQDYIDCFRGYEAEH